MKPDVILHSRTFHIRVLLLFSIEERHIKICSIEVESIQYLYDASFIHHINKHQLNMTSKKKKKNQNGHANTPNFITFLVYKTVKM